MTLNMGNIDRILRALVGVVLIAAAFGAYGAAYQSVWGWIGIIPLASGLLGYCPVYNMYSFKTSTSAKVI